MRHKLFNELLAFFDELSPASSRPRPGRQSGTGQIDTSAGIFLMRPPLSNDIYLATPTNTRAFARTGMDGCHYSFLLIDGEVQENSPVVMTYPSGAPDNVIVGEDLFDFLCLGIGTDFAAMEELAWEPGKFIEQYPAPGQFAPSVDGKAREVLGCLAQRFSLKAWTNVATKLAQLEKKYHPWLRYSIAYLELFDAEGTMRRPRTPEDLGRKLLQFRLFRGGAFLGIVTENPDRNRDYGYPWYSGLLTPSVDFATVRHLFEEQSRLGDTRDFDAADRVGRSIMAAGLHMEDVETGEVYPVVEIGIDGNEVHWTACRVRLDDDPAGEPTHSV
jgi:hypothetical protein